MNTAPAPAVRELVMTPLDAETFAPFGAVLSPQPDGTPAGPHEGVLDLTGGTPRFYTMQIPGRGLRFGEITHHRLVTQALGSAGGRTWCIAVAPPGPLDVSNIRAFQIPGDTAILLNAGTWHAGPLFDGDEQSFFNLELSDTNQVDHHTIDLVDTEGFEFLLVGG